MDVQPIPENVGLTQYGGLWERLGAFIVDNGILSAAIYLLYQGMAAAGIGTLPVQLMVSVIASWTYFAAFESSKWMGTPGKKALDLVVADEQGQRITLGRAVCRGFFKVLLSCIPGFAVIISFFLLAIFVSGRPSGWIGPVGLLTLGGCAWMILAIVNDARKQGIHDKITHTLVFLRSKGAEARMQ